MERIHFIITGGTIDSEWLPAKDTVVVKDESGIEEYINKYINPDFKIIYETIAMKDSRDITDEVRKKILTAVEKSPAYMVVITHGTYTMADTGMYLKKHLGDDLGKRKIILTGSFWPLSGFAPNDAAFNLGYAVSAVQSIDSGVYLAMHAKLFEPEDVKKDTEKAHFKAK